MSSRIRSRSLCSRLSRQGFPCSWCGLGAVLLFVMAYPPVAETSSEEIPVLFSTTSQEHTPFTFLQESGQNRGRCAARGRDTPQGRSRSRKGCGNPAKGRRHGESCQRFRELAGCREGLRQHQGQGTGGWHESSPLRK